MRRRRQLARWLLASWISMSVAAQSVTAQGVAAPPETGLTMIEAGGARIFTAVMPGRVLATSVAPGGAGVAILVAPQAAPHGPRALYRLDVAGAGSLVELASDLPEDLDALAHLDLGGGPRLVAGEPGWLYALGALDDPATRRARLVVHAPHLDLALLRRHRLIGPGNAPLVQPRVGRLEIFRPDGDGALELAGEIDLPVRARRRRAGLELSTPPLHLLAGPGGKRPLYAIGPEAQGKRRLLTTLIELAAEGRTSAQDPPAGSAEAWSQLPATERVDQSWILLAGGQPILVVATVGGDKIGILEKKKLRLFPLRTDRTRAGARPVLAIDTVTRHWHDLGVHLADLDRDGQDDLIVVQPDGLGAKKLVVEVYRGQGSGGFFRTPRRSVVGSPEARWSFAGDVDGDHTADLVTVDERRWLQVFRGLAESRKLAIEKTPRWSFDLGAAGESDGEPPRWTRQPPEVADLDGDGRAEILLLSESDGRSTLRVIAPR